MKCIAMIKGYAINAMLLSSNVKLVLQQDLSTTLAYHLIGNVTGKPIVQMEVMRPSMQVAKGHVHIATSGIQMEIQIIKDHAKYLRIIARNVEIKPKHRCALQNLL